MKKLRNDVLKLAIQKKGRLTENSLSILRLAGFELELVQNKLYTGCQNYSLEIFFIRHNDIPGFLEMGAVDLGIIGQDILSEKNAKIKQLLPLNFGHCTLCLAVPKQMSLSDLKTIQNLRVATTYPNTTEQYFQKLDLPVKIVKLRGSVEIAPELEVADAIVDIMYSGYTLAEHNLKVLDKIFDSQAILASSNKSTHNHQKKQLLNDFTSKIKTALLKT